MFILIPWICSVCSRPPALNGDFRPFKPARGPWRLRDCSPPSACPPQRHWPPPLCGRDTTLWLSSESPHDMSVTHSPLLRSGPVRTHEAFNSCHINIHTRREPRHTVTQIVSACKYPRENVVGYSGCAYFVSMVKSNRFCVDLLN